MTTPIMALKICKHILAEAETYPPELKRRALDEARSAYRVFVGQLQRERGTIRLNRRKK